MRKVSSTASDPNIDPQIWFEGTDGGFHVVRGVRWKQVCLTISRASWNTVNRKLSLDTLVQYELNADEAFDPDGGGMPLWRGHGLMVGFDGLIPLGHQKIQ